MTEAEEVQVGSVTVTTMSLVEMDAVHTWMGTLFKSFGIKGEELDRAIVASFYPALRSIENHRLEKPAKRARLKLVE